jgi:cyclic beta-1,2-glucan synthetase
MLAPCIPEGWPRFEIAFRHRSARYEITVENPHGVCAGVVYAELDGKALPDGQTSIALTDDGGAHKIRVILGEAEDTLHETGARLTFAGKT